MSPSNHLYFIINNETPVAGIDFTKRVFYAAATPHRKESAVLRLTLKKFFNNIYTPKLILLP